MSRADQLTMIGPSRGWRALRLGEIIRHRDLLKFLIWRDLKVRYQQTVLGGLWAVIQPLGAAAAFTLVFGRLAKIPSDGVSYPIFSFTGLVIWTFFSQAMNGAVGSLIGSTELVEKVYFPRLILPLAAALRCLPDLAIAFGALLLALVYCGIPLEWRILWLLPLTLLALVAATGVGCALGAINVRFRDVRHVMPLLTQLWLFLTPVAYPASLAPERLRPFFGINPMAGVVEGFRWAALGAPPPSAGLMAMSVTSAAVLLLLGLAIFRRMESTFADVI
jgi:lipopolysaccharide transport system permease protein